MDSPSSGSTLLRVLMLILIYAIPVVVSMRPIGEPVYDPDIWWHLRTGQWIVENRTVPGDDPFSQVQKPWVAYSWLYELLVYKLYCFFGLAGIVAYRVGMSLAITAALHRLIARREPRFLVATGLTAVSLLAIAMLFGERPWLFSILFSIFTLSAILDLREGRPSWLTRVLPFMFVLWANIHIQFVYGLGLLGLACVAPWVDRWLGAEPDGVTAAKAGTPAWRRLAALSLCCFVATFINPYHFHLYGVVIEYATQPGPFRFVNELKALEYRAAPDWVMLGLAAAATFALGRRSKLSSFDLLLMIGAAMLAFRARRDLWLLVLASAVILTPPGRWAEPSQQFALTPLRFIAVAVGVAAVLVATAWQRDLSVQNLEKTVAKAFPVDAAKYVAQRGYKGPLFNDFNWGGYLIWALPNMRVAIDGRTNLYGDERIQRIGNTWAGGRGWRNDADLVRAVAIVADSESALCTLLTTDTRFVCVYRSSRAWVFIPATRGGGPELDQAP